MTKVLVITSSFPRYIGDSSGSFLFELLKRLATLGHEVHVIAPHANHLRKTEFLNNVLVHRFQYMYPAFLQNLAYKYSIPENIKRTKFSLFQIATYTLLCTAKALQILKARNIDIIVAFWAIPQGFIGAILKKITGRHLIVGVFPVELSLTKSRYRFAELFLKKTLDIADIIIANSNFTKHLTASFGVSEQKVVVVYPGVESKRQMVSRKTTLREKFGLRNSLIILAVGRLVERKGFEYLIEAMPAVLDRVPNAVLVLVGDGPLMSALKQKASRLGVEGKVLFQGGVSDYVLRALYAVSDVFVLPAIIDSEQNTEGLGVVLLEAMSMAKPVVASRVGGIPEVVLDKETGFLIQQRSSKELANAITTLLTNRKLSIDLGRRGKDRVREKFDWDTITQSFSLTIAAVIHRAQVNYHSQYGSQHDMLHSREEGYFQCTEETG